MIKFAEDLETCRKLTFSRYFTASCSSSAAFEDGESADEPCGHCDNVRRFFLPSQPSADTSFSECLRDPSSFTSSDVSLHAYRALRILSAAASQGATLTLNQAVDLVRGLGGGSFATQTGKSKGKGKVDVVKEAGGKVMLPKEVGFSLGFATRTSAEHARRTPNACSSFSCSRTTFARNSTPVRPPSPRPRSLADSLFAAAYTVNSYVVLTSRAVRFSRLEPDEVAKNGAPIRLEMGMQIVAKKRKAIGEGKVGIKKKKGGEEGKGKKKAGVQDEEEEEEEEEAGGEEFVDVDGEGWQVFPSREAKGVGGSKATSREAEVLVIDDD